MEQSYRGNAENCMASVSFLTGHNRTMTQTQQNFSHYVAH